MVSNIHMIDYMLFPLQVSCFNFYFGVVNNRSGLRSYAILLPVEPIAPHHWSSDYCIPEREVALKRVSEYWKKNVENVWAAWWLFWIFQLVCLFRLRKCIFYKALEFYLLIFEGISTPNHVSVLEKRTFQARLSATILLFLVLKLKCHLQYLDLTLINWHSNCTDERCLDLLINFQPCCLGLWWHGFISINAPKNC